MFEAACVKPEKPQEKIMLKSTMYFGRKVVWKDYTGKTIEDQVTQMNWIAFLEQVVEKHFSGYTWYDANGVWMGEREETFVLEIIHEKASEHASAIAAIAGEYRKLFNQDSVAITVTELTFVQA